MKLLLFIVVILLTLCLFAFETRAQQGDSIALGDSSTSFRGRELVAPLVLVGVGTLGATVHALKRLNVKVRDYLQQDNPRNLCLDDYMQYAPALSVYALNLCGVRGEHRFVDRTIILATAYLTMSVLVTGLKYTADVERPDGHNRHSFPSGHTATAFLGAEFLRMEYRDKPWIAVAGYGVAAATGFMRMYNNKHWLSDVVMGAGIGILSTRVAYWMYKPVRSIFPSHGQRSTKMVIAPMYDSRSVGAVCMIAF